MDWGGFHLFALPSVPGAVLRGNRSCGVGVSHQSLVEPEAHRHPNNVPRVEMLGSGDIQTQTCLKQSS